ncbi:alkaline phosphatase D family protein [Brevundimonas naejangsanensis]|uniref:alkaline phosphatase D family protein n=1 Tax=Brevundimonas naejangsanensis TaxID=588932 RepID=UPI00320B52F0
MTIADRREFLAAAAASFGAALVLAGPVRAGSRAVRPAPERFPQGVASGDPQPDSIILWTRRPPRADHDLGALTVETAEDEGFRRVVARAAVTPVEAADWTCRALVAGLKPGRTYWYRFIDADGGASRTGRTFTAPAETDAAPARFAFVSCQNVNLGYATPYRRMIAEDAARPEAERLRFVLHLGDFIYEMIWSPKDQPTLQGRSVREIGPLPTGARVGAIQVPTTVADYRHVYQAYLADPDIQDARALWPFICVWDNHEFSNRCWQSQINYDGSRPAQSLKAAANQAWFEYIPARVRGATQGLERFLPPAVQDAPLTDFDADGLSHQADNQAAINSLLINRALRWGANVELILTDNRSFRSQAAAERADAAPFAVSGFPWYADQTAIEILDAGRAMPGGAPETIRFNAQDLPNPRRDHPPGSMLGARQKLWLKERLTHSTARWKLWGNSVGMLHRRTDWQNLPEDINAVWPTEGYGLYGTDDWCGYPAERRELLNFLEAQGVTNVAALAGDRHSFFAGLLSPDLPPGDYRPTAAEFVVGSISTPSSFEAAEAVLPLDRPLSPAYLHRPADGGAVQPAMNLAIRHGVRACYALKASGRIEEALAASNPHVAPHLAFADLGGHGYALVVADHDALEVEFVATPRPVHPPQGPEGIPLAYRATHRLSAWSPGEQPRLERVRQDGVAPLILDI